MAQYAYPTFSTGNTNAFRQQADQFTALLRRFYEQEPRYAYEAWISALGLTPTQEQSLRSLYDRIYSRYINQVARGWPQETTDWVGFLTSVDPYWELARLPASARGWYTNRFQAPVRWLAF